jgi:hypothetical protein
LGYTRDGNWRVVLSVWKFESPFYSTIGANAKAQHWETQTVWLFVSKTGWFDKPADSVSVSARFEGILPSTAPGVATRGAVSHGASEADVRYYTVGGGLTLAPDIGPAGSGGATDLRIRSVRATGGATINGEGVECAEVYKA